MFYQLFSLFNNLNPNPKFNYSLKLLIFWNVILKIYHIPFSHIK